MSLGYFGSRLRNKVEKTRCLESLVLGRGIFTVITGVKMCVLTLQRAWRLSGSNPWGEKGSSNWGSNNCTGPLTERLADIVSSEESVLA